MHYVAIANAIGFSIALEPENSELKSRFCHIFIV